MRHLAEQSPERAAHEVVPAEWVTTLTKVQQRPSPRARTLDAQTMTIAEFVKHLGGLGGHLERKCDGPPGWITL